MSLLFVLTIILVVAFAAFSVAFAREPTQFGVDLESINVRVIDGDTFVLNDGSWDELRVRVAGIDAPERGQLFHSESKASLEQMLEKGRLECMKTGTSYNRIVAQCSVSNQDIGYHLLWEGLAFHDSRYTSGLTTVYMSSVQKVAQIQKRGVWSAEEVVYPWDYRKIGR